jgi:hypothetical protein
MTYQWRNVARITAADADAEPEHERLFSTAAALPSDLIQRDYKLITRAPDRMFAVSPSWGCTGTKRTLDAVVKEARELVRYLDWISEKQRAA